MPIDGDDHAACNDHDSDATDSSSAVNNSSDAIVGGC